MKHLVLIAGLLISSSAFASSGKLLDCGALQTYDGKAIPEAPSYSVFKQGKRMILREVQAGSGSVELYDLKPSGGDDDYVEYSVVDPKHTSKVQAVDVQEKMEWAALIDNDGYSVNRCD